MANTLCHLSDRYDSGVIDTHDLDDTVSLNIHR